MERFGTLGRKFLTSFCAVFTCVILASTIFIGMYSNPYLPFRLIVQALVLAAVGALLNFIYLSEKPIHKRSMAIRTCVHFSLLISAVAGFAWRFEWFSFSHMPSLLTFFLLFLFVYAIIWVGSFIGDLLDEKRINDRLQDYQSTRSIPPDGE